MGNVYTIDEEEILAKTRKIRVEALDQITKNGPPERTNELRVMNELANSLDESVHKSANNRIKHEDASNKEALAETISIALLKANSTISKNKIIDHELPTEYIPDDIVPGETDVNPGKLLPSDYLNEDDVDTVE